MPADLLLITWNRRAYVERTLATLLGDPADYRLYWWDNHSTDGTAELVAGTNDLRIVKRHLAAENVKQREPFLWFLDHAQSDLIGKVDDDLLVPAGWTERIAPLLRREPRFGVLGCWVFMPEDWDENRAGHKIVEVGGARVFVSVGFAGAGFLGRKETLARYITPPGAGYGLPLDRVGMSLDGLVNGCPLPVLMAHHMDDPRSPHYLCYRQQGDDAPAAETATAFGFTTSAAYAEWIAQDARRSLEVPFDTELRAARRSRSTAQGGWLRRGLRVFAGCFRRRVVAV